MWPFGRKKVGTRLAAASSAEGAEGQGSEAAAVAVLTTIVSPANVVSPLSGTRAAIVVVELVERIPVSRETAALGSETVSDHYVSLGCVVLGDMATLRDLDGDEVTVVVHRASIRPAFEARGATPVSRVPAEVVPLLQRATGRGVVCYRELTLGPGDKVLLKALVEPATRVVTSGYRSATCKTYVARDDLAPVVLEEVPEPPPW